MYIGLSYFSVSLYSLNLSICISSCLSYSTLTLFFVDFSNKSSSQKKGYLSLHPYKMVRMSRKLNKVKIGFEINLYF